MAGAADYQNVLSHLAAIVESAQDAVIGENLDSVITSWNQGAENLFGYVAEEAIGRKADMLIPEPRLHEEREILQKIAQGERVENFDTIRMHKDGRLVDVSLTISPIRNSAGRVDGASKIAHDITERKQTELKLAHLAAIVESSDDAIVSTTPDGIFTSWNRGAERLFGYTAEEAIGKHASILTPPDQVSEEPALLQIIRNGERIEHFETARLRKDGTTIEVSMTVSPIRNPAEEIVGISGIARDISDSKWAIEARERRQLAQKQLRQLSERDREILSQLVAGAPNKAIARLLDRSEKSVEKYRAELMKKLGARSLADLVRIALSAEL